MSILRGPSLRKGQLKRGLTKLAAFTACNMGFSLALKTGLVVPFMYCHGCPLASFACPIGALQHFLSLKRMPFLVLGTLILAVRVLGRARCGWLCPFGALQDLLSQPRRANRTIRHGLLHYLKYLVILGLVIASLSLSGPSFCWICPVGALFAGIPYLIIHPDWKPGPAFYIHMVILGLVLLLALRVPRAWCRYFCPLGAISGLFNKVSLLGIEFSPDKCVNCGACVRACLMGLRTLREIGSSPECILCGRCVEACPTGALAFSLRAGG